MSQPPYLYTSDLADSFFILGPRICARLACAWADLLAVMNFEADGIRATAHNIGSNASGLIQFEPITLTDHGWMKGPEEFRKLDATAQLPWVERYLRPYAGKMRSVAGVYLAVFEPAHLPHQDEPDYVLEPAGSGNARANPALRDTDGAIRVSSAVAAVTRGLRGPRWEEAAWRAGILNGPPAVRT